MKYTVFFYFFFYLVLCNLCLAPPVPPDAPCNYGDYCYDPDSVVGQPPGSIVICSCDDCITTNDCYSSEIEPQLCFPANWGSQYENEYVKCTCSQLFKYNGDSCNTHSDPGNPCKYGNCLCPLSPSPHQCSPADLVCDCDHTNSGFCETMNKNDGAICQETDDNCEQGICSDGTCHTVNSPLGSFCDENTTCTLNVCNDNSDCIEEDIPNCCEDDLDCEFYKDNDPCIIPKCVDNQCDVHDRDPLCCVLLDGDEQCKPRGDHNTQCIQYECNGLLHSDLALGRCDYAQDENCEYCGYPINISGHKTPTRSHRCKHYLEWDPPEDASRCGLTHFYIIVPGSDWKGAYVIYEGEHTHTFEREDYCSRHLDDYIILPISKQGSPPKAGLTSLEYQKPEYNEL